VSYAKMAELIEMLFGIWTQVAPRNYALHVSRSPQAKGQFLVERTCPGMPHDILSWAVQKWLNRSRCCLGYELGWAQGSMCYMGCTLAQPGKYDWTIHVRWTWKNGWPFWMWTLVGGPKEPCTRWGCRSLHANGQFLGERSYRGMPGNTLPKAV